MVRPFRFGVQTKSAGSRAEWVELARKIEDRGYSTLTMPDHFDDQLAPVVALMAAADATEVLRIGSLVWCNDYRHPVVFAKEAATPDRYAQKLEWVREGAGDRFDDIELQVRTFIVQITDDRRATAEMLASSMNISIEEGLGSPLAMVGTPGQIAEDLRERREKYGFSYIVVGAEEMEAFAPVVAELAGT